MNTTNEYNCTCTSTMNSEMVINCGCLERKIISFTHTATTIFTAGDEKSKRDESADISGQKDKKIPQPSKLQSFLVHLMVPRVLQVKQTHSQAKGGAAASTFLHPSLASSNHFMFLYFLHQRGHKATHQHIHQHINTTHANNDNPSATCRS